MVALSTGINTNHNNEENFVLYLNSVVHTGI